MALVTLLPSSYTDVRQRKQGTAYRNKHKKKISLKKKHKKKIEQKISKNYKTSTMWKLESMNGLKLTANVACYISTS